MRENAHYRIALADDHAMVRRWVRKILETKQGLVVVGEARDGLELLEFLEESTPDLILLDLSMPRMGGLDAARIIKQRYLGVKVLILTMHKNRAYLEEALLTGAEGYLLKEEADRELLPAIAAIREGKTYISPLLA